MSLDAKRPDDPTLRSWVESANDPATDFPIQNLPFGVFRRRGADEEPRVGVAIGDRILDIASCRQGGLMTGAVFSAAVTCEVPSLNALMAMGRGPAAALRARISALLCAGGDATARNVVERSLVPMDEADMLMPVDVGDYTDFYASVHHATNVGSMFRPENPLLPNYKYVPIAYHGRASSIQISGMPVRRPLGQSKADDAHEPVFGPSKLLDYELEVGFFVAGGNSLGEPIPMAASEEHIFGFCIVNDWSARDIQKWEYQPLGPFLAKNFATSISPWIVTLDALDPFRTPAFPRAPGDPEPLPHLRSPEDAARGGIDITLEVYLSTQQMLERGIEPHLVSRGSYRDMYWTAAQMIAHHTSGGCNLRPGDLLASGTVSGASESSQGCLLERTWRGTKPIALPTGEVRRFLQDGDEVLMRGYCERQGAVRIGFGECRAEILPAPDAPGGPDRVKA